MADENFMKAVTDALTALGTLQNSPLECQRPVKSNFTGLVTSVIVTLKEIDPLWSKYESAEDSDTCGRAHARIQAKFKMIDERIQKFQSMFSKALDESGGLRGNLDYLKKRVSKALEPFPKTPRRIEPQINLFEELDTAESPAQESASAPAEAEPVRDAQWEEEEIFTKRLNEFRVACANFVNSYDERERETGVVGMVNSAGRNAKHVEEMWRRYLVGGMDVQIAGNYNGIGLYIKSIGEYLHMADGICRYLNADGRYRSSIEYVGRKYTDFKDAYPSSCRVRPSEFGLKYAGTSKSLGEILAACSRKMEERRK